MDFTMSGPLRSTAKQISKTGLTTSAQHLFWPVTLQIFGGYYLVFFRQWSYDINKLPFFDSDR